MRLREYLPTVENSSGNSVEGFERHVERSSTADAVRGLAGGVEYLLKNKQDLVGKFELRLIKRGGQEYLQLRKKPGALKSFFATKATKARVEKERKDAIDLVSRAFSRNSGISKALAAARNADDKMGTAVGFVAGGDRGMSVEQVKHLLAMSDAEFEASRYNREAIDPDFVKDYEKLQRLNDEDSDEVKGDKNIYSNDDVDQPDKMINQLFKEDSYGGITKRQFMEFAYDGALSSPDPKVPGES